MLTLSDSETAITTIPIIGLGVVLIEPGGPAYRGSDLLARLDSFMDDPSRTTAAPRNMSLREWDAATKLVRQAAYSYGGITLRSLPTHVRDAIVKGCQVHITKSEIARRSKCEAPC